MHPSSIAAAPTKDDENMEAAVAEQPVKKKYRPQKGDKRFAKSRVTNGGDVLPNVDQRSAIARRYRDIASQIIADQGGADRMSESRLQLIRRFAAASCLAEQLEGKLAAGEEIDVQQHALLCSALTRLIQRLGIDRRAKNITPTLSTYLLGASAVEDAA